MKGRAGIGNQAKFGKWHAESGITAGQHQITAERNRPAKTHYRAVHSGNDRLVGRCQQGGDAQTSLLHAPA